MARPVIEHDVETGTDQPARDAAAPPAGAHWGRSLLRHPAVAALGLFVLLCILCAPVVALHERRAHPLFILDEFAYADYLHKVHDGQPFVRRGEITGQETLRELACRGYSPDIWPERPPCDAPSYNAADFPNSGIDSADIHPPTYFVLTDLGARVIMALGISDNLVNAGRLFGAAWMAAGLCALWYLMRALGVGRWAAALGLGLVAANPSLRWAWYYLTPDAANLLVGSVVVLAALRWERRGRGLLLLAGSGAFAMAFKAPNVIVVTAVAAYLAVRGLVLRKAGREAGTDGEVPGPAAPEGDEGAVQDHLVLTPRRYFVASASLLGGGGVVALGWLIVRSLLAIPGAVSPMAQSLSRDSIGIWQITENLGRFITVWDLNTAKSYPLALITSSVLIGSLVAGLAAYGWRERKHTLALVTGVMVVVGPLILVASNFITTGTYFLVEPRYGATLVPLECALAACLWRGRAALYAVGALVVAYNAAVLILLLQQ